MPSVGAALAGADLAVFGALAAAPLAVGAWVGRRLRDPADFYLGRRRIPAWAACVSLVSTEVGAATIIGLPAMSYGGSWRYVQFFLGSAAARIAIAAWILPALFRTNCTSVYEYLGWRFGPAAAASASSVFLAARVLGSAARLAVAAAAVAAFAGWPLGPTIALFVLVAGAYISAGGLRAVVWTNVLQAAVFVVSGLAALWFLLRAVHGGPAAAWRLAAEAGRADWGSLGPSWTDPNWLRKILFDPGCLWAAAAGGFVGSLAAFGTDQEFLQALLAVPSRRDGQRALAASILPSFLVLALHLSVGTALYASYAQRPELALPAEAGGIYPHFAAQELPVFWRGLFAAALFLASVDLPLAALATSFVVDLYRPYVRAGAAARHYLGVARLAAGGLAAVLGAAAYALEFHPGRAGWALRVGAVASGSLLGVFALGLWTQRRADKAAAAALGAAVLAGLFLLRLSDAGSLPLGWNGLAAAAAAAAFATAWAFGPVLDGASERSGVPGDG